MKSRKPEILAALRGSLPDALDLSTAPMREARKDLTAVRIRSELIDGDIWLARDEEVASELAVEVAETGSEIPILTFALAFLGAAAAQATAA